MKTKATGHAAQRRAGLFTSRRQLTSDGTRHPTRNEFAGLRNLDLNKAFQPLRERFIRRLENSERLISQYG
jgi:hypothetical protein